MDGDSAIAQLLEPIREELAAQALSLGVDADALVIEPILNWGGFVNRSFRVSDGHRRLFLKLTSDADARRGLERWRRVGPHLESHYHAPQRVGWIDLPTSGFSGPLFEWIDGQAPLALNATLATGISEVIRKLHCDVALGRELSDSVKTCTAAYMRAYHDRFTEDLAFVAAEPPPFVDHALIGWLKGRIEALEARARELPAFELPADRPIHGDLWLNNVWLGDDGEWYLLDWDGVGLGDPVIDWTMLFGPTRRRPYAAGEEDVLRHAPLDREERARLALYVEASQLDWVLDPLADWVQGGLEPEHGDQIRTANEHVHRQALEAYRARWGGLGITA